MQLPGFEPEGAIFLGPDELVGHEVLFLMGQPGTAG
jgi:hypothetical protein